MRQSDNERHRISRADRPAIEPRASGKPPQFETPADPMSRLSAWLVEREAMNASRCATAGQS